MSRLEIIHAMLGPQQRTIDDCRSRFF